MEQQSREKMSFWSGVKKFFASVGNFFVRLWNFFTVYEKIWYFSIVGLSVLIAVLFPSTVDDLIVNPSVIMILYVADVILNATCELLISKQSRWNFIVSLFIEITEIATLILIGERFATMAVTIFFWIPADIISFITWNRHIDKKENELTVVRTLSGWQEVLLIVGIFVWTIGVGYLLTVLSPEYGILESNSPLEIAVNYLDAACSAVAISNGLFILFRYREQWISWYIVAILETVMNIIMGQWVLLVLKAGYFTNTTYGYIKWTKYIKTHKDAKNNSVETKKESVAK
jgi:nicotinamide mononucleotide transporter